MRVGRALFVLLAAGSALGAEPTGFPSSPLAVYVGERGQLQAVRTDDAGGIFYPSTSTTGDAGFFLAFPAGATPAPPVEVSGHVYGFVGLAGRTTSTNTRR
jgi:hypothetical protein